jgi:hypothetical protein
MGIHMAFWHRNKQWIVLLVAGAIVACGEALILQRPGTMDACYSYVEGNMLAAGKGWMEPFIWNYLDDPASLPHPAFMYWMPLTAVLSSIGVFLTGDGFRHAQIGFWFLVAVFPAFVFWLARHWSASNWVAWMAALFAMFPGFYATYGGTTDAFMIFAWIGGGILVSIAGVLTTTRRIFLLGLLCGLAHLTRADGILFFGLVSAWIFFLRGHTLWLRIRSLLVLFAGYGAAAGAWYLRNLASFQSFFAPSAGRALWIQEYNQLFHFPAGVLTPQWWLAAGWTALAAVRWDAFLWNLQTTFFVLGLVFFAPFIAIGIYRLRKAAFLQFGVLYYLALFILMTLVFPLQGSRGGLFHSSAAMLPLACICAATGLEFTIRWLASKRAWNVKEASIFLGSGIAVITVIMTVAIVRSRVNEGTLGAGQGGNKQAVFRQVADRLAERGESGALILVGDPPCYFAETLHSAIAIPEGGVKALFLVASRFHAEYILLDGDVPPEWLPFYRGDEQLLRLEKIASFSDGISSTPYNLYRILPDSGHADD